MIYDNIGVCSGIVTSTLYVPPSSAVSSVLAPLLPSYTIQTLIENELAANLALIPNYISQSCVYALRRYLCGTYMLGAQLVIPPLGIYLQSYLSNDICINYQTQCYAFIAASGMPSLVPNCSATSAATGKFITSFLMSFTIFSRIFHDFSMIFTLFSMILLTIQLQQPI